MLEDIVVTQHQPPTSSQEPCLEQPLVEEVVDLK